MNIQTHKDYSNEFRTRLAFSYDFNVPYSTISNLIRKGEIELHLIDGKIQINVEEALKAYATVKKRTPTKLIGQDLFA
jgi:hypothetical protein